ncbi:MAG: hypothetical protein IJW79_05450 [Clostridia bacterium]|nr:hypothetical protein [Clostridia bacterium]
MKQNFEIERKFLIEYPNTADFEKCDGFRRAEIAQTYLSAPKGEERRIRCKKENGETVYFKTLKKKVTDIKRIEEECEITAEQYRDLLKQADPDRRTLEKTRYSFSYLGKVFEVDVYPFWSDKAIVEIELADENEEIAFPCFIKVIKEVTEDESYKNYNLCEHIPRKTKTDV